MTGKATPRVIASEPAAQTEARQWPQLASANSAAPGLARQAERELRQWGHGDHDVRLERVSRMPRESGAVSSLFWCENCHVSQLLVRRETGVRYGKSGDRAAQTPASHGA